MKDFIYCTIITLLVLLTAAHLYTDEVEAKKRFDLNNGITFIWNDDEESIPKDGSLIKIEYTDENNVYIGPVEERTDTLMKSFMDRQHKD